MTTRPVTGNPPVPARSLPAYRPRLRVRHRPGHPSEGTPRRDAPPAWHTLASDEVLRRLGSSPAGLRDDEAATRLEAHGPNTLPSSGATPRWRILARQFTSPLISVLLAAAVVSMLIGHGQDAVFIGLVLAINAAIGTWQEAGAERSAAALQHLLRIEALAVRVGRRRRLPAEELVPGDVVELTSGDRVPADARLLRPDGERLASPAHAGLRVDESALTGESQAVEKDPVARAAFDAPLGDRTGMVFAGTTVAAGRATAVVVATGAASELGRIASAAGEQRGGSAPLVVRMERFTRQITLVTLLVAALYAGLALAQGEALVQVFFLGVALLVSAIPEGLPVALTSALAVGANRMARRGVIVRGSNAVEGLGSTTVVASDKTGTLTVNRQTVRLVSTPGEDGWSRSTVSGAGDTGDGRVTPPYGSDVPLALGVAGALANEATLEHVDGAWRSEGDAVDVAVLALAFKLGVDGDALRESVRTLGEVPYESERAYAATRVALVGTHAPDTVVAVKGAVESVLTLSGTLTRPADGGAGPTVAGLASALDGRPMDGAAAERVGAEAEALAAEGYRVLAVAAGRGASADQPGLDPADLHDLTLLGLVAMIDPLRPEAREAVATARRAGVLVTMVTGDHPATAQAIGRDLGLLDGTDGVGVVTGPELAAVVSPEDDPDGSRAADDPAYREATRRGRVFARVAPLQKLQIVRALQADGHFAAVTGDGVNDAPALRAANIGVAMGSGTDAAKDVADLIVTDDDFASLVTGIEQGRHAYANVRKVIWLLVATGAAELALFLLALLVGLPAPLIAVQLLWLNVVTNGIQSVALAFEGGEPGVMRRPPRDPDESVFDRPMVRQTLVAGAVMALGALGVWWWALEVAGFGEAAARNLVLLVMVLFENVHAFNARSETTSAFQVPFARNRGLVLGVVAAFGVHVAALSLPPLQAVLGTAPVTAGQFGAMALIALGLLAAVEALKAWRRRDPHESST